MKNRQVKEVLFLFICMMFSSAYAAVGYAEADQLKKDERITKNRVVRWADSVFYFHEDYRFENFHVHYTDEFYVVMLRSDQYRKKISNLEKSKKNKTYKGTDAEYEESLSTLKRKYKRFQVIVESFTSRVRYIEVLFWSNIKTKHGYPVYYSHRFKLSNDYFIMAALIKSSIGNRSPDNSIIYN